MVPAQFWKVWMPNILLVGSHLCKCPPVYISPNSQNLYSTCQNNMCSKKMHIFMGHSLVYSGSRYVWNTYQCALQLGFRVSRFASQLYQVDCGWKRHKCPPKLSTSLTNFMVTAPCTVTPNWLRKKWTNCMNPYISWVKKDQWLPDASSKISREWVSVHIMRSAFKLPGLVQKRGDFPPGFRE